MRCVCAWMWLEGRGSGSLRWRHLQRWLRLTAFGGLTFVALMRRRGRGAFSNRRRRRRGDFGLWLGRLCRGVWVCRVACPFVACLLGCFVFLLPCGLVGLSLASLSGW